MIIIMIDLKMCTVFHRTQHVLCMDLYTHILIELEDKIKFKKNSIINNEITAIIILLI